MLYVYTMYNKGRINIFEFEFEFGSMGFPHDGFLDDEGPKALQK